jgi:MT0933-like antitoxin protein
MGMFDNLAEQATNLAKEHSDVVQNVVGQAAEQAGAAIDNATGGKFTDQIEGVTSQADDQVGNFLDNA